MAGATNRALKAAGVPKASIKTIRVKAGGRLSLKSALGVAAQQGLDVGKAHEHLARREAKTEAKAAEGRKAAMLAAGARRQQGVTRALGAASSGMLAARKAAAERARAEAQRPTPATGDIRAKVRAAREANRTAMSGYGKMPAPMLNQARQTISDARATMRAAGPAPAGKAHVILNGSVAAVAPTKRAGHFFAYEQGGKSHVAHDATGASIGTYSSQAAAHKALDGMRKTGDRLNAGLLRGDEKAIRLGARFQRATQREGAAAPPKVAAAPAATPRPAPQPRTAKPAPASPKVAAARTPAAPSPAARAVYQRSEAGAAAATGAMRKDIRAMVKDVRGHREHLENLNDTRKALDRRKKLKAQQVMVREVITEIRAKLANSERALAGALAKRGRVATARATQSRLERGGQQRLF